MGVKKSWEEPAIRPLRIGFGKLDLERLSLLWPEAPWQIMTGIMLWFVKAGPCAAADVVAPCYWE